MAPRRARCTRRTRGPNRSWERAYGAQRSMGWRRGTMRCAVTVCITVTTVLAHCAIRSRRLAAHVGVVSAWGTRASLARPDRWWRLVKVAQRAQPAPQSRSATSTEQFPRAHQTQAEGRNDQVGHGVHGPNVSRPPHRLLATHNFPANDQQAATTSSRPRASRRAVCMAGPLGWWRTSSTAPVRQLQVDNVPILRAASPTAAPGSRATNEIKKPLTKAVKATTTASWTDGHVARLATRWGRPEVGTKSRPIRDARQPV